MFKDRTDAANQLAAELIRFKNEDVVVLAIPRGGLPIGSVIAKTLNAPLDIILTKKIGHPLNKEYAVGAVSLQNRILDDTLDISERYIEEETQRIRKLLQARYDQYYKKHKPQNLKSKTVIIVDDGIATGNTLFATVDIVQQQNPTSIIVAVPVAPASVIQKLRAIPYIDEVLCLKTPYYFEAVGLHYIDFKPVTDNEAIKILEARYSNTQEQIKNRS
jgi:putative phosphoribosyl transferase